MVFFSGHDAFHGLDAGTDSSVFSDHAFPSISNADLASAYHTHHSVGGHGGHAHHPSGASNSGSSSSSIATHEGLKLEPSFKTHHTSGMVTDSILFGLHLCKTFNFEIEDKLMSVEDKKVLPNKIAKLAVSQDINYVL